MFDIQTAQGGAWKGKTALFLAGQGVSLFGSMLVQMAIIWYVTLQTQSGVWVSALTLCSFVPQCIVSPFAGAWADRHDRRRMILCADAAIATATLALACLMPYLSSDTGMLTALLVISAIRSLGAGVQTPAVGAMLPMLVPEKHLMRVNGWNAALQSGVQFAAPAAAGALLSLGALRDVLWVDVATALVGIGLLLCISVPSTCGRRPKRIAATDAARPSAWRDLRCGVRYAASHAALGKLMLLYGGFIFLSVPSGFLSALLVGRTFGDSYALLTAVELAGLVGMTAGGLLLGGQGGFRNRKTTLCVGLFGYAAFGIALGCIANFAVFAVAMALLSFCIPFVQTAVTTLIQETAQSDMQGRMFGLLGALYSGCLPIGMAAFGPAAQWVSVQTLAIGSGAVLFCAVALLYARGFFAPNRSDEKGGPT